MNQDDLKKQVAAAAAEYVQQHLKDGEILGVGTGSTANLFIDALQPFKDRLRGAVASSEASRLRLEKIGIPVVDLNSVERLSIYVDGADEIDHAFNMIKGGGGALTREKIVAAAADTFVCIADASKRVERLGAFPLPVEVIPMAVRQVERSMQTLGGNPVLRADFITDNGNLILDVQGLDIADPPALENRINQIVGVVCNGIFAARGADVLLLGTATGVQHFARQSKL